MKKNKENWNKNNMYEKELEFRLQELNKQQEQFFERMRNCDVKLGFMITLISGLLIYFFSNNTLKEILSFDWITEHNILIFVIVLFIEVSIVSLLLISLVFALIGIKTRKGCIVDSKLYVKNDLLYKQLLEKNIELVEKALNKNIKEENKKNNCFDVCLIIAIIVIFIIAILETIKYFI